VRSLNALPGVQATQAVADRGVQIASCAYGAHLLSWRPDDGIERLFLSSAATATDGVAIRGGVPVIFPQFAERGPGRKHGFARTAHWHKGAVEQYRGSEQPARQRWLLTHDDVRDSQWPNAFFAALTISAWASRLDIELAIANMEERPIAFTAALHTYLRVASRRTATVEGLQGCRYIDTANGGSEHIDEAAAVQFATEVDRIYLRTTSPLRLSGGPTRMTITASGFCDTVLWNPGSQVDTFKDLPADEAEQFVCVESACIGDPVVLAPGEVFRGLQTLTAEDTHP
jgi:glucose-6-phosphate 1-epimerase